MRVSQVLRRGHRFQVAPRALFDCARDGVPELARAVAQVERVARVERARHPSRASCLTQTHRWWGRLRELPALVRPFVRADDLEWHEHGIWDHDALSMRFEIEVLSRYREAVHASGEAKLRSVDHGSVLDLACHVDVDAERLHQVPRWLRGAVAGAAERFLVSLVGESLATLFDEAERQVTSESRPVAASAR